MLRLSSAPIVAFAAADSPHAARGRIDLATLAGLPLVLREQGSRTRRKLEEAAEAAGLALVPAIEAEGREAVREIVAAGGGIGVVSAAEFGADPRLVPIEITGARIACMDEALICLRERRSARLVQAFFDLARTAAARD